MSPGERDLVLAFPGAAEIVANLADGRAEVAGDDHAAGVRALDPAGTAGASERRNDRILADVVIPYISIAPLSRYHGPNVIACCYGTTPRPGHVWRTSSHPSP